jgi:leader peptidase (prepilin peptidase)/N-methyltransferase
LTAFLFWCVAAYFGTSQPIITLGFYAAFLSWLLALSMIDIDTQTLPNSLTQSGLVVGLIYQGSLAFTNSGDRTNFAGNLINGIVGAVIAIWVLEIIRIGGRIWLQKEAMGGGDPKLAAMIGMWLGWQNILLTILIASAIGALIGGIALTAKNLEKHQQIPFGPFLAIGGAVSLFFGKPMLSAYLGWFGL